MFNNIKAVHNANKPVSPSVWQVIVNLNLPLDMQANLNTQQNQNGLSVKNQLIATTKLYTNQLGLAYSEKVRRFAADTTLGSADSVLAIYDKNVFANSTVLKANALISLQRYTQANTLLNQLESQGGLFTDYVAVQREFIQLNQQASYKANLASNLTKKANIQRMANSANYLAEGLAISLLQQVWNIRQLDEEKPRPESPTGNRLFNNTIVNESQIIQLNENILVYPNPAQDVLNIDVEGADENTSISILDVNGKVLISQTLNASKQIKTDVLSNGVYFINLQQNTKTIAVKKVVIVK